jgi:hypothetical protein
MAVCSAWQEAQYSVGIIFRHTPLCAQPLADFQARPLSFEAAAGTPHNHRLRTTFSSLARPGVACLLAYVGTVREGFVTLLSAAQQGPTVLLSTIHSLEATTLMTYYSLTHMLCMPWQLSKVENTKHVTCADTWKIA